MSNEDMPFAPNEDKRGDKNTDVEGKDTQSALKDGESSFRGVTSEQGSCRDGFVAEQNGKGRFFAFGIASMVLGIVSVLCCCFFGVPIVFSVTAIVFAGLRINKRPDGFAIAGLVTGIVGLLFNVMMLVFVIANGGIDVTVPEIESLEQAICAFTVR